MASKDIVGKKGTRKSRRRECLQVTIIEDDLDDVRERTRQFFSKAEAFNVVQETVRHWKTFQWVVPLPPVPTWEKFLKALELQTSVYDAGSLDGGGFHLEIVVRRCGDGGS